MLNFELYNPVKVLFGAGEIKRIGEVVAPVGKKALIVSYEKVDFYGNLFERIQNSLSEQGVASVCYFGATANPKISEALGGIRLAKDENVDCIVGVGGGSAMDLAKVIAAGVLYPHDIRKMIKFSHSDDSQILPTKALPTVMIPTLPGTASEMNPTAVITDDETLRKSYIWEPSCLYPIASILDTELTLTLPTYQTACGAIDAISHAIEPFFFSNEETFGNIELQSHMQMGVIRAIYENLPKVLENPNDIELRGLMQFSATVALNGWLTCGVQGWTPMHQMGHVLSSHFKATHGATLACMMLAWMRFFANRSDNERFERFSSMLYGDTNLLLAADKFESYIKAQGVETRISQLGCSEKDIDLLTKSVVEVSFGADKKLASVPAVTAEEVTEIFRLAL